MERTGREAGLGMYLVCGFALEYVSDKIIEHNIF